MRVESRREHACRSRGGRRVEFARAIIWPLAPEHPPDSFRQTVVGKQC